MIDRYLLHVGRRNDPQVVPNHNVLHVHPHFILQKQSETVTNTWLEKPLLCFQEAGCALPLLNSKVKKRVAVA